jgi:glycosyltransferase involved in cell wall biosynthesis
MPMENERKNRFRCLFLASDRFPPFRADVSVLFGKLMVERGHVIDWILQSDATVSKAFQTEWMGCRVWVGPNNNGTSKASRAKKNILDFFHDLRLFSVLKQQRYDFIIVRDKFITPLMAILASAIFKVKFVYWHSYPFPEDYLHQVRQGIARYPLLYWIRAHVSGFLLYRIIMPLAEHVFVQTEYMRNQISKHGIAMEKLTPVPMGVSLESIPFFGDEAKGGSAEKRVVYLGTLFKTRKMDFLVRVFAKVLEKERKAKFYLVGGGEDRMDEELVRDEARRLGIEDSMVMTGFLPQEAAWQHVKDADVCVSPICPSPILECGSPTKLIEYMAMGKASVANDHQEQSLVLAESRGGICVPYEENAFAEAVVYLIGHPEEARAMGLRGRHYVEERRGYQHLADLVETMLMQHCMNGRREAAVSWTAAGQERN